jgi:sugar phosphate isomerase/epimerase
MDRRSFLGTVTAASLMAKRLSWAAERKIEKVGLQLYTVRDQMKQDFFATIARVARVGYTEVEFAGYFDQPPEVVKRTLTDNGLTAPSAHVDYLHLTTKLPEVIEAAKTIGHSYIVCPWIAEDQRSGVDGWKRIAAALEKAGGETQRAGIQLAYHNHNFEFVPTDGKLPYDILLANSDSQLVNMEMDLYWITKAGQDPLKYWNLYPGRFSLVHVKGMDKAGDFTEVGGDTIDWKKLFSHSEKAGIKHYFVEQDKSNDPFASIQKSYAYLRDLRFS